MSEGKRNSKTLGSSRPFGPLPAIGALVVLFLMIPLPARSHGLGGLSNLPAPLSYFLSGVATVLIAAFALLTWRWPHPRWQEAPPIRRLKVPGWRWIVTGIRAFAVGGLVLVVASGLLGAPNSVRNPGPVLVWVVFWLVVPILGAILGDVYRLLSPWRSLAHLFGVGTADSSRTADAWGVWPATLAFVAFVWFGQIYPNPAHPRHLAVAALAYTLFLLGVSEWLGQRVAIGQFDAFTTYNRVVSAIAPLDLDAALGPGWRGWLRDLPLLPQSPGITPFVVTMLGSAAFHGMSSAQWYETSFGGFGASVAGSTVLLLLTVGVVAAAFWLVCDYSARQVAAQPSTRTSTATAVRSFTHVLVPIAFAYMFAHYFTAVIFEGQLLLSTISDPFGLNWDLFGTANRPVDFTILSPASVWWIQVTTIVVGHMVALILAHDRALGAFDGPRGVRAQYSQLVLIVVSAGMGLTILATG